jgi:hypothetical protein
MVGSPGIRNLGVVEPPLDLPRACRKSRPKPRRGQYSHLN